MIEIALFVEDYGHETLLQSLLNRLATDHAVAVKIIPRSTRGGHGRVEREFKLFVRDLLAANRRLPDLIVAATDANCEGYRSRKKRMAEAAQEVTDSVVYCIPDPHLERWLLLDSAAFKKVLGKGCAAPDQKCDRDRYKKLLIDAVLDAGLKPQVGGIEHAADLVSEMDLDQMARKDDSFRELLETLRERFRRWKRG